MPEPLFARVTQELDFPKEEREVLRFWQSHRIFQKTLEKPAPRGTFVFYEGPPTANGLPHNGHVLTRVIKDVFPRYKTMRGWSVPRKAGWDTHGLPVEVEVEKELRIHGKAAIEEYGVEPFVKKCIESVFRYTKEWEDLTERVAFWVDLRDAYVTYHRSYVESVWWALGELFKKGLLYQGHKVVWWWAQGGTALSSGEVGQGYRTVDDPSVYVAFPLVGQDNVALLVWTTTPWTLPSNMYAAVNAGLDYVVAQASDGRRYVVAKGMVEALGKKLGGGLVVEKEIKGRDLVGAAYRPPFDLFAADASGFEDVIWRVIAADFVTLDAGTGIVHVAPAFGEDDHEAHRRISRERPELPLFCAVKPDGTFIDRFEACAGRWVKDCDKSISHDLKDRGLLVHAEQYRHDYPFCWRADSDPLIQYARPAWYIRTTSSVGQAIANNRAVHWLPEHIKEGRFGDFLANNVDWALSRERWWGTPLNVWVCEKDPEHMVAPDGLSQIEQRNPHAFDHFYAARRADPSLSEHLIVHKPWIDQVTIPCESCGGVMRRVPEVIDCWFDSGCMPFAQWGYPHVPGSTEKFEKSFPADFISEAIDQTRGWFYSLLMISTLVFDRQRLPHPYKTCIVLGHVSDKEGKKESKSKGNYTPPEIILDKVAMEFAVLEDDVVAKRGEALVGREDLEGLDLDDEAHVRVYRGDAAEKGIDLAIRGHKKLKRRVVVLHPDDRAELGVLPTSVADVLPAAVPRLPPEERVFIEDPATPAPGADAFRWFFYAASPPWSATRHSLSNVRALQKEFAVKLRNVYSFFTIYANIDGFRPSGPRTAGEHPSQPELDRWIRSELALTTCQVTTCMNEYDVYAATQRLVAFVDALSNWWVRRSRSRFWRSGWDADKGCAYDTLYECLVTVSKLTAPFTPYAAEAMYQNLVGRTGAGRESVHLEDWPEADMASVDAGLSRKIEAVRALVSLGLQVRTQAKIKVRQPLRAARIVTAAPELIDASAASQLMQELNVEREVETYGVENADEYVEFRIKPSFRSLGKRGLGKEAQVLKRRMGAMSSKDAGALASRLMVGGTATLDGVELSRDDIEVEFVAKEGFAAAGDRAGVVVLDTRLDDGLRDRGLVRELQYRIQALRKELALEYTDRIRVTVLGSERIRRVLDEYRDLLAAEVLAVEVSTTQSAAGTELRELDVEGESVRVGIVKA
ncbi:MAG: isoleucine--tRNA ligase [Polyangiaceae bacterium]|jgi:isoleucyl-tRNA synthetase